MCLAFEGQICRLTAIIKFASSDNYGQQQTTLCGLPQSTTAHYPCVFGDEADFLAQNVWYFRPIFDNKVSKFETCRLLYFKDSRVTSKFSFWSIAFQIKKLCWETWTEFLIQNSFRHACLGCSPCFHVLKSLPELQIHIFCLAGTTRYEYQKLIDWRRSDSGRQNISCIICSQHLRVIVELSTQSSLFALHMLP